MNKRTPLRGAIAAMLPDNSLTNARVIGIDDKLPWHYSEDLKHFKKRTMGSVIVMGRVTWESIGCRELPGRKNVVISRSTVPGVEHYDSVEKVIDAYPMRKIWFIGGAQIYKAAMPYLDLLCITYIPEFNVGSDGVKFPEIDLRCWHVGKRNKLPGNNGLFYVIYKRVRPD